MGILPANSHWLILFWDHKPHLRFCRATSSVVLALLSWNWHCVSYGEFLNYSIEVVVSLNIPTMTQFKATSKFVGSERTLPNHLGGFLQCGSWIRAGSLQFHSLRFQRFSSSHFTREIGYVSRIKTKWELFIYSFKKEVKTHGVVALL